MKIPKTKVCSKCGIEKDRSEFHKSGEKNYLRGECKECVKIKKRKYYLKNRDSILMKNMEIRKNNLELVRKKEREYYANNREKKLEQSIRSKLKNKETTRKYRLKNKDRIKRYSEQYYKNNREEILKRYKRNVINIFNRKFYIPKGIDEEFKTILMDIKELKREVNQFQKEN